MKATDTTETTSPLSNKRYSYETALAVVPPDDAWDRIQRARHYAMDVSYDLWPPAIRLFHPFVDTSNLTDVALDIAQIVENFHITPFEVTLCHWSIVPHQEALDAYFQSLQELPPTVHAQSLTTLQDERKQEEELRAKELIAYEERRGREKYRIRQQQKKKKERQKQIEEQGLSQLDDNVFPLVDANNEQQVETTKQEERNPWERQQAMYEEFNGPCVLVLEPDEDSKEKLQSLRYMLNNELSAAKEHYSGMYSPSGSISMAASASTQLQLTTQYTSSKSQNTQHLKKKKSDARRRSGSDATDDDDNDDPSDFRPLVPIAAFSAVSKAIPVARRLRNLWTPLSFNVTDLHLMSCRPDDDNNMGLDMTMTTSSYGGDNSVSEQDPLLKEYHERNKLISNSQAVEKPSVVNESPYSSVDTSKTSQFGCDALVSFVGEEIEMDNELNEEMATMLYEQGEHGGYEQTAAYRGDDDDDDDTSKLPVSFGFSYMEDTDEVGLDSELERWIMEEEEGYDEGTVVVLGRTQFFTGEMREYVGMPASSSLDTRDKVNGDHFVSGAARRRGVVHRSAAMFEDGDWGQKDVDYQPWSKSERSKKSRLTDGGV